MPNRSNRFQKLIYLLHSQLAGSAEVVESMELKDLRTGGTREIDIGIRSEVAGYPIIIGIECRDHKRPQSSTWVEEMWAKHLDLPTATFVLVSSSGFYKPALEKARTYGIEALSFFGGHRS